MMALKKCRHFSVTNNFIFSHNSFKLLPYEVVKQQYAFKPAVYIVDKMNLSDLKRVL